jgi:hypothetical protein
LIFYPAVLAQYAGVKLSLARLDAFFALEVRHIYTSLRQIDEFF